MRCLDSYDFVYCRTLLQHLSDPVGLLRPMWAAVRTGGTIAVEDADFDGLFCDPDSSGFAFYAAPSTPRCTRASAH